MTTVDHVDAAGDVGRGVAGEKDGQGRDLVGLGDVPKRQLVAEAFEGCRILPHGPAELRANEPRADGVDADVRWPPLGGEHLREADQRGE